jgi:putative sterol carrier protein
MNVEDSIASLVDRFNRRVERTPAVAEELAGIARTISIRLTDGGSYAVDLDRARLLNLRSGTPERSDLTITTDVATFDGLVRKEIGPMKAIVTGKLKIAGSLEDKILLRRLL